MNIEIIKSLKERAKEMLKDNYNRKIGDEEVYTIICELENFYTAYEKEKEKNKKYEEIICRVRNLSNGVVSYDIVEGKKYLGPRKNFSKQRLYEQFLNIELILKGNYIFLSNEEFLKELIEKTEKEE